MEKINLQGLDQDVYKEILDNGLQIFLVPYTNKQNYFVTFATKYGSDVIEFKSGEKVCKPPLGVAHFLEHKMFEQENGEDPFTFFSKTGTDSNASTSFDSTQYLCYGTNNFKENLRYLLSFVNSPYYTDENVQKEKGIIAEEIKMYADMPDFKLEMKLREAIYKNNPRRIDIAGTVEEINKITKEDLYDCYNNFYIPNNMFILIAGNFNIDDAIEVIKEECESNEKKDLPVINQVEEPNKVYKEKVSFKENIEVPKIALGIKVPTQGFKISDLELDLYLNMITTIMYGSSSEFRERVRNQKLISGIYTEWESIKDFKVFYLMATSLSPDRLLEEIKYELENHSIREETFNRIKKVWIANEVKMIDSIDSTVSNLYDDILKYNDIIPNKLEVIRNMDIKTINKILKQVDWKNISIVKMECK